MELDSTTAPRKSAIARAPLLILAVALLGASVSIHSFHSIREAESKTLQTASERRVDALRVTLKERLVSYRSTAWSIRQLTRWMGSTNHHRFAAVAQGYLNRLPEVKVIELSPYFPQRHREMFEAGAAASGIDDFDIWRKGTNGERIPVSEADHFLPIFYVEPLAQNRDALGLDLLHTANSNVIAQCRDTGRMRMPGPIRLTQDPAGRPAVVFYSPRYRGAVPADDPTEALL